MNIRSGCGALLRPSVLSALAAIFCSASVNGAVLYFSGSYDLNDATTDENSVPINYYTSSSPFYVLEQQLVYNEFVVPAGQSWTVTSLFEDDQYSYVTAPTTAVWQIRTGMSGGSGGTLLFSGSTAVTITTLTPADGNNYIDNEYQVSATVPSDVLTAGTYWEALAPTSAGYYGDQSYVETTSGANEVGQAPANGGQSFVNNNLSAGNGGQSYAPSTYNYAEGLGGTSVTVPEPASILFISAFIAGCASLTRRRR